MNRAAAVGLLLLVGVLTWAQQAEVVYVEGVADIRESRGSTFEAAFGDGLYAGDSVLTGADGRVELEQADESTVRIAPDTVFVVREVVSGGERSTVYSTEIGSAFFRFRAAVSKEPRIATPSSVAGVRGTAFTVFSGADGSALYVVEEGRVDVTASGATVSLGAGEGVEVVMGTEPGDPFVVRRGAIDYSEWNAGRLDAMRSDPVAALAGVARRMGEFVGEIEALVPRYEANVRRLDEERKKLEEIEDASGKETRSEYYVETVFPLEIETSNLFLNIRYYALSALSLRRVVMTGMYIRLAVDADPEFHRIFRQIDEEFERSVAPRLVDADF